MPRRFAAALLLLTLGTGVPAAGLFLLGTPRQYRSIRQMVLKPGRWVRTERRDPADGHVIAGGYHVGSVVLPSSAVFGISGAVEALAFVVFALAGGERRWRIWGLTVALAACGANTLAAEVAAEQGGFLDLRMLGLVVAWGGYAAIAVVACAVAAFRPPRLGVALSCALLPTTAILVWIVMLPRR